ncbi:MAG: endonuclease/exonuclease/phosphatase family protein [Candidatus Thiodiazotropha taylori]|nr:endonuclease/exonuclease/phosphatase family protein [Candidatus Thiodiazotropha taylori]
MQAVMPKYCRMCKFSISVHFMIIAALHLHVSLTYSFLTYITESEFLAYKTQMPGKAIIPGKALQANSRFAFIIFTCLYCVVFGTWLNIILLCSGDVHPNPGPSSTSSSESASSSSSNMSTSILNSFSSGHNLSFVHYNIQSISSKLDLLHAELFHFDILAFTETWLSASIETNDLMLESYNKPERKDRVGDHHGGVMLYVKETIFYKRREDLEIRGVENIWIELANNHKRILFGIFYRPPNSDANYFSNIEDSLALAVDTAISDIIVTGDFNLNILSARTSRKIESLCLQFSFYQSIDQPTHFTENSSSLIDLLLVSNKDHLLLSGVGDPFLNQELRYHCPIYGIFKFSKPRVKTFSRHVWYYERGNFNLFRDKASTLDWESLQSNDINVYADNINTAINSMATECIPSRHVQIKPLDPPWLTTSLKRHIRKRKRAFRKAKRTNLDSHWKKFKKLRNKVTTMIRDSKKSYYDKLADRLKSSTLSTKDWWSTLKGFINPNSNSSIPPLEHDNKIYTDECDKANILNKYFQSQTLLDETNAVPPDIAPPPLNSELNTIVFTPLEVESVLKTLTVGKASGPNGLSNRILKELSFQLSVPFCSLFNQSLQTGFLPSFYKEANVCPVPKKGDLSVVSNHRPISLLNAEAKVFERLVFKYLFNHLRDNNLLSSLQSGFIPGDSTVNQLTFLYNTFCQALDSGKEVRAVFCDISKAFDRVWHIGLLHKLRAAGVTGEILNWFKNYLSNRKQRVVLPGAVSDWLFIRAGVPQGSILGPLLFLLYINDIVTDIGSNIRLFADDTSLYIVVDDPTNAANCLNTDLDKISRWAATWLVSFNPTKTESLLISRKLNRPHHPALSMQNHQIIEVDHHKHLGIYLSNDCTWHHHINYIKEKAWFRVNIMRRLKFKLDRKSLEVIYTAFIRPLLEYSDVIWDNCTEYEKNDLDKIQNEAARIATGATKLVSLNALSKEICWESLEQRRKNHRLTLFYKMFYNLTPLYLSSLVPQSVSNLSRYNLRNSNDLQTVDARTSQYYHSFLPSTTRDWNSLSTETKQSDSVNSFKHSLNKDKPSVPSYFYTGSRIGQILHSRIRTNCSSLNLDLFLKNITESPLCRCGSIENAQHFFFHCRYYEVQRRELMTALSPYLNPSLKLLLNGDSNLSPEINNTIFLKVHKYIIDTHRF